MCIPHTLCANLHTAFDVSEICQCLDLCKLDSCFVADLLASVDQNVFQNNQALHTKVKTHAIV
jgi:ABC-type metal ion transport system substrate-binding protein